MNALKTAKTVALGIGFRKGLNQVRYGDYREIRAKLFAALGVNNRNSFYYYANGQQELRATQIQNVSAVFKEYGITDIWGTDDETKNNAKQA